MIIRRALGKQSVAVDKMESVSSRVENGVSVTIVPDNAKRHEHSLTGTSGRKIPYQKTTSPAKKTKHTPTKHIEIASLCRWEAMPVKKHSDQAIISLEDCVKKVAVTKTSVRFKSIMKPLQMPMRKPSIDDCNDTAALIGSLLEELDLSDEEDGVMFD